VLLVLYQEIEIFFQCIDLYYISLARFRCYTVLLYPVFRLFFFNKDILDTCIGCWTLTV